MLKALAVPWGILWGAVVVVMAAVVMVALGFGSTLGAYSYKVLARTES